MAYGRKAAVAWLIGLASVAATTTTLAQRDAASSSGIGSSSRLSRVLFAVLASIEPSYA